MRPQNFLKPKPRTHEPSSRQTLQLAPIGKYSLPSGPNRMNFHLHGWQCTATAAVQLSRAFRPAYAPEQALS